MNDLPFIITLCNLLQKLYTIVSVEARNLYWRGTLSTVDLLVPTSFDQQFFFIKQTLTYFFTSLATLMRTSAVLSLPFQLVFLGGGNKTA
jgi:hypothetical protein